MHETARIRLASVIRRQWKTQADFTYSILGNVISIIDLDLGNRSVTNDIENILRKIEYYHQGSVAAFHIMYRDSEGIWDGIDWDGKRASFFALRKIEEGQARKRLLVRRRVFLIDTDTAADDPVAIMMALRARDVRVAAITTVAGNVGVEQAARNALCTAEICDINVPVHLGAQRPLLRAHQSAQSFYGTDGLSDRGYPAPKRQPEKSHAVEAMIETVEANPGLVLVTLGPLTNVALALARQPDLISNPSSTVSGILF